MKLEFKENQVVVWVMESPQIFRRYGQELMTQTEGGEGGFVLSHNEDILDIKQSMEMILTPYQVDLNDKKCLNKVYAELKELAYNERYYLETQSVLAQIHNYLMGLEQDISVSLFYENPDIVQIFKAFGMKLDEGVNDMQVVLAQYMNIAVQLLGKKVLVFTNLSFFMEKWEIEELLKEAFYMKIAVILIEQREIDFSVDAKCYIIDKDGCEIF